MNLMTSLYGAVAAVGLFSIFMGSWWFYTIRPVKH